MSLGGRLNLIKDTLTNIPIYWMALARISKSILDFIRKKTFNFLWKGKKERFAFHLVKWKSLSMPKCFGGWGLKNLFHFGMALSMKSLWRCLFGKGMWHKVIMYKYWKNHLVEDWLRDSPRSSWNSSNVWSNCLRSFHIVSKWISRYLGNGCKIRVGMDLIIGLGSNFQLHVNMREIHEKGIYFLNQIKNQSHNLCGGLGWKSLNLCPYLFPFIKNGWILFKL